MIAHCVVNQFVVFAMKAVLIVCTLAVALKPARGKPDDGVGAIGIANEGDTLVVQLPIEGKVTAHHCWSGKRTRRSRGVPTRGFGVRYRLVCVRRG